MLGLVDGGRSGWQVALLVSVEVLEEVFLLPHFVIMDHFQVLSGARGLQEIEIGLLFGVDDVFAGL